MQQNNKLISIFTGTEVEVMALQAHLDSIEISSVIQNKFQASIQAGFVEGTPSSVELFIQSKNLSRAEAIIENFQTKK